MNSSSPPGAEISMNRQLALQIINAAIEVHRQLGPGLLESVHLEVLLKKGVLRVANSSPTSQDVREPL